MAKMIDVRNVNKLTRSRIIMNVGKLRSRLKGMVKSESSIEVWGECKDDQY